MRDSDYPLLREHYWTTDRQQGQFNRRIRDGDIILLKLVEEFGMSEFTRDDVQDAYGAYVPTGRRGEKNEDSRRLNLMAGLDSLIEGGYLQEDKEGVLIITDLGRDFADKLESGLVQEDNC